MIEILSSKCWMKLSIEDVRRENEPASSPWHRPTRCLGSHVLAAGLEYADRLIPTPPLPASAMRAVNYTHSIVAGGFPEMSYTTREIPDTSLTMRRETWARNS